MDIRTFNTKNNLRPSLNPSKTSMKTSDKLRKPIQNNHIADKKWTTRYMSESLKQAFKGTKP